MRGIICTLSIAWSLGLTQIAFSQTSIPGVIEAENFDSGGYQISYFDWDIENRGGALRQERVDIYKHANGHAVGWGEEGEWLKYSISVQKTDYYKIKVVGGVPSPEAFARIYLNNKALGESFEVPKVNKWREYKEADVGEFLIEKGNHTLELYLQSAAWNGKVGDFDKIIIEPRQIAAPPSPYKVNIKEVRINDGKFYLPSGYQAKRVIITKGYDANSFTGIVIARNVVGPAVIDLPSNFKSLPRTAAGELLIWIDFPINSAPFRQLEFWTNPDSGAIRFGEIWHATKSPGGSWYQQQGYKIKLGSSSSKEYKRAYVIK